jgi:hypothetical protein
MIKAKLKKSIRIVLDIFLLIYGMIYYYFNQNKPINERTPPKSYLSMIRLFCVTSGRSNDFISKCISLIDKPVTLPNANGILGNFQRNEIKEIANIIERDGFYIFEQKLPNELIQKLYHFASHQKCYPRPLDENVNKQPQPTIYDRNNLLSSVYDIPMEACIANTDISSLIKDHSILAVSQEYLKTSPKADVVAFWWSTPFSNKPQVNSAQLFHFDMDRFKWLKFFIFLTDVTLENGPHVFIKHSHQTGKIPKQILKEGYSRIPDEEVFKHYPMEDVLTFTIPAGTIVAEDTRGLHKGTNLLKGERLVLELQMSNSLFGACSPSIENAKIQDEDFLSFIKTNKKIFKLYPM